MTFIGKDIVPWYENFLKFLECDNACYNSIRNGFYSNKVSKIRSWQK